MKNQKISKPKNLRQKLLMIYHDDGILDLVVGITILMLAGVMAFEVPALIGLIGIPLILYIPIKEQISIPRIGFIRFETEDVSKKRMVLFLLVGVGFFAVFVFLIRSGISPNMAELIGNNEVLIFSIILAATLFISGRILNNPRFLIYSMLSLVLVLGASWIGLRVWLAVALVAVSMEVIGAYKLVHFLRAYPRISGDEI